MPFVEQDIIQYFINEEILQKMKADWISDLVGDRIPISELDLLAELTWEPDQPNRILLLFAIRIQDQAQIALTIEIRSEEQIIGAGLGDISSFDQYEKERETLEAMLKRGNLAELVKRNLGALRIRIINGVAGNEGCYSEHTDRYMIDHKIQFWEYANGVSRHFDRMKGPLTTTGIDFMACGSYFSQGTIPSVTVTRPEGSTLGFSGFEAVRQPSSLTQQSQTVTGSSAVQSLLALQV